MQHMRRTNISAVTKSPWQDTEYGGQGTEGGGELRTRMDRSDMGTLDTGWGGGRAAGV